MAIHIHREGGRLRLIEELLARRVRIDGYVVFTSMRTRQRQLVRGIQERLDADGIASQHAETTSPNGCMCVVDSERYSLLDVLARAAQADREDHEREFGRPNRPDF